MESILFSNRFFLLWADENRERVIASGCLPSIVMLLNDDSMLPYVIPVLFNICVEYGKNSFLANHCELMESFIS